SRRKPPGDLRGHLAVEQSISDALGHQTSFTYDPQGQPQTITTPAGTTQLGYTLGDLTTITDQSPHRRDIPQWDRGHVCLQCSGSHRHHFHAGSDDAKHSDLHHRCRRAPHPGDLVSLRIDRSEFEAWSLTTFVSVSRFR